MSPMTKKVCGFLQSDWIVILYFSPTITSLNILYIMPITNENASKFDEMSNIIFYFKEKYINL